MKERNNFKKKALFHVTKVLWHLDIFRRSFRELSGHACMADSCIFCALKDLFGQLQFSHERALPPDALRKALAQSFSDQHRFQLGFMDDAAECFENILLRIHFHIAYNEAEDMCNAKHCIPHQKFAMTLVEQSVCGVCHATSEPLPFTQMVHYVSASALISQAKQFVGASHPDLFGQLLKKAGGMGDIRDCPSTCGAKIQIRRTLINRPEIVSVGIVWDSDRPSLEHIMSLLDTLRIHLRLSDVFHGSFDAHHTDNVYHQLVGVVTYYGKHYSTFFFHTKLRVWVYFDDANVREVGPHWQDVVEKCRRGRYQPLLLLFANPNGIPVDASHAPKSITLVDKPKINLCNGHDIVGKPPVQKCSLSPTGSLAMGGRRSLTPSPEKPRSTDGVNQRRAVTPNPEQSTGQINAKSVLPNNDYQNLVQFQEAIFNRSNVCEDQSDRRPDVEKRIHPIRKELVRRDSGNWSGDRNSASSSSSTSLENPYHYIIGKMHLSRAYGGIPRSPNKNGDLSSGSGNSSGGPADPGYDSFSLSSTDSLPIQQNLKYNFQLAQIPEGQLTPSGSNHIVDENTRVADDCERLCAEVDQLLDRSEQAEDLITALSLCNAAVNKARAAMDAPYSNPQTASFATMKHNACILRARSLHRKLEEPLHNNLKYGENRHNREGSGCSGRGSTGSHSRQNSKDKSNHGHSRQNSQELLDIHSGNGQPVKSGISQPVKMIPDLKSPNGKISPSKNIEIYATLPKNKKGLLSRSSPKVKNVVEDEEYLMKERPGRSLLGNRSKTSSKKEIEKRARSEERNTKNVKEVMPVTTKEKEKEQKELKKQAKQEEKQNKKQHKIRRKLLMGGLMRRKNRSMPDLRDEEGITKESPKTNSTKEISKDDSMVNSKTAMQSNLSGYLSEGNLEYTGNPNLERSKLMRKSFHGSKIIPFNKVPPPPPLRTTSQLSKTDRMLHDSRNMEPAVYANNRSWSQEPTSLPFLPRNYEDEKPKTDAVMYSKGGYLLQQPAMNTVVTEAQIHHDASFQSLPSTIGEPDFINKVDDINFQLPPYPSPIHSTVHSRQASEDFPPPPATLAPPESESSFLAMLQEKCEKMGMNGMHEVENEIKKPTGGENWLKELQAKQAERRKVNDQIEPMPINGIESKNVKDLKSKFEQLQATDEVDCVSKVNGHIPSIKENERSSPSAFKADKCESHSNLKNSSMYDVDDEKNSFESKEQKRKAGKKKNVTFCEQVVLVATADDQEADSYIPNPILERVLRTVLHKESNFENKEYAVHSVVPLKRTDSWRLSQGLPLKPYAEEEDVVDGISVQKEIGKAPICRPTNSMNCTPRSQEVSEAVDEVDGPCSANHEFSDSKTVVRQNMNGYINSQAYSPTYIPASSLCPPCKNDHRCEYPEPASLQSKPNIPHNGYIDSHNEQLSNGISHNQSVRKFNESYSNSENVRYSPICNQEIPHSNGFYSGYSPYQSVPTSYSNSASSYQPMSLQYYPSQNRSSPQIPAYREQINQGNVKPVYPANSHCSSLSRQNSTISHCNKQVAAVDPRRLPVSSISPQTSISPISRLSDCQRSQYYNMQQFNQKSTNGVSAYQLTSNGNCSPYGYNNDVSKSSSNSPITGPQNLLNSCNASNVYQQYSPSVSAHQMHNQQSTSYNGSQNSPNLQLSSHQMHTQTSSSSYNMPVSSPTQQYLTNSSNHQMIGQHTSSSCGIPQSVSNQHYSPNSTHVPIQQYSLHSSNISHQNSPNSLIVHHHQIVSSQQYGSNSSHASPHLTNNSILQQNLNSMSHQNIPSHLTNGNVHQNVGAQNFSTSSNCDSLPRNSTSSMASPYQSIPHNSSVYEVHSRNSYNGTSAAYQHVPYSSVNNTNSSNQQQQTKTQHRVNLPPVYQHPPPPPPTNAKPAVYQRVPTPNQQVRTTDYNNSSSATTAKYFPYQHPPMPKQMDSKKTNAVVPCNLCRKKQISPPSVYCTDCDFYISRFKQKA